MTVTYDFEQNNRMTTTLQMQPIPLPLTLGKDGVARQKCYNPERGIS